VNLKEFQDFSEDFSERLHKCIGKNVKEIRKSKGISQLELAYSIGYKSVSPISCAEIYYNKIHFNIEQLVKISKELDVDICSFFKGVDEIIR
jgi:transcriptional regulator with XRE-family HTH domain